MSGDFRLGGHVVHPSLCRLVRDDGVVHLRAKVMDLLVFLSRHPGEVLSKGRILDGVWGTEFVSESALTSAMTELRHALGDVAEKPALIETIPKRGYRLIAPVEPTAAIPAQVGEAGQPAADSPEIAPDGPAAAVSDTGRRGLDPAARRPLAAVALTMLATAAALIVITSPGTTPSGNGPGRAEPPMRSVAVLPLRDLTGEREPDWFAEAMTEELTVVMSRIQGLRVISGISARHYRGSDKTAPEIAAELGGIDWLLDGSVRRAGGQLHIRVHLDEVSTNRRVWTESFEATSPAGPDLADQVARRVALEIGATLTRAEEARLASSRDVKAAAYEAYLHGRYFRDRQMDGGCEQAEPHFLAAIAHDPTFAAPHAARAYCYGANRFNGRLPALEALATAQAEVARALELDPQSAEAFVSLALMQHRTQYDWAAAERSFQRALSLHPGHAEGLVRHGELLYLSNRSDEGLALIRRGVALVPFSVDYRVMLGYALYNLRRFDEAIAQFSEARALDPSRPFPRWGLAQVYAMQHRYDEAVTEELASLRLMLVPSRAAADSSRLQAVYARAGWEAFWQEELRLGEEGIREPSSVWQPSYRHRMTGFHLARVSARMGARARAIDLLGAAYAAREGNMVCVAADPVFDGLRDDPRFQDLVRRVGLSP